MNKAFEKVLERLEEKKSIVPVNRILDDIIHDKPKELGKLMAYDDAIKIVQEVAEEYEGGWIPCSERLPDDDSICIVTVEYPSNETVVDYGWFDRIGVCWHVGMQEFRTSNIIAWQPLPEPYKEE